MIVVVIKGVDTTCATMRVVRDNASPDASGPLTDLCICPKIFPKLLNSKRSVLEWDNQRSRLDGPTMTVNTIRDDSISYHIL